MLPRRTAITGATTSQRVKSTHGVCGEHSMTHLVRYPATRQEVTLLMTLLPFSRTKSTEFGHLLLRRPSTTFGPYRATPTLEEWTAVTAEELQQEAQLSQRRRAMPRVVEYFG